MMNLAPLQWPDLSESRAQINLPQLNWFLSCILSEQDAIIRSFHLSYTWIQTIREMLVNTDLFKEERESKEEGAK